MLRKLMSYLLIGGFFVSSFAMVVANEQDVTIKASDVKEVELINSKNKTKEVYRVDGIDERLLDGSMRTMENEEVAKVTNEIADNVRKNGKLMKTVKLNASDVEKVKSDGQCFFWGCRRAYWGWGGGYGGYCGGWGWGGGWGGWYGCGGGYYGGYYGCRICWC